MGLIFTRYSPKTKHTNRWKGLFTREFFGFVSAALFVISCCLIVVYSWVKSPSTQALGVMRTIVNNVALVFVLSCLPMAAVAKDLCPKVQSQGEGHWPIEESQFTERNAKNAVAKLERLIAETNKGPEYFAQQYGVSLSAAVFNATVLIRGYALRKEALRETSSNSSKKVFCRFLTKEAAWQH